ncbi:glycine zipper 2TM domain-containing protein [Massilia sp. CFBP 13721]|uniref:glycine zipper 2TM domain-containing protein n=1 Tax=Massilia sp. CFBP 13721 TaxID=2775300 RepID=UPI0027D95262|nr:glycine zipper 2TM domain-containing protein [Massilia sp. CFBP 13721]
MKLRHTLSTTLVALLPLCSMTLAPAAAHAQQYERDSRGPSIRGFNVEEVRRLAPGVELHFDLYGTPGGNATLRIDGATRNVHMTETEPGQYVGTYVIGARDRIVNTSAVTANLRVGNRVATDVLSESVVRDGAPRPNRRGDLASVPRIERFEVRASDELAPGNDLGFTVFGTPGARVELTMAGARGVFFLPEVRPGEYAADYTIRRDDRIAPNSRVTATIRANGRYTEQVLGRPLLAGGPRPVAGPAVATSAPRTARYCTNCATVEAVNVVEVNGQGNYLGTAAGAVVGGLLGNQVGSGSGRKAATAAGAIGGAVAGNAIQRNQRQAQRYEVVVRYAGNGATQTLQYDNDPGFRVGDPVRVNNGVLSRDQ